MKRFTALLLCFILILSLTVPSFALQSQDKLTPAPEITGFTKNADGTLGINVSHALESAEELRKTIYDIALEQYKSEEALLASPEKYLCYETKLYLEISTDNAAKTVREITEEGFTLTKDDILPFAENGTLFVKILLASENFRDEDTKTVYIYRESVPVPLMTDGNAVFPVGSPITFEDEIKEDISLFPAKRTGYIFDGWSCDGSTRIGKIPAGTKEITLFAHFIPMQYEINYVLTTDMTYPFGRADNSKNPVFYTVGEGARLYDIQSPTVGYTFGGWYLSPDFSGDSVTEIAKNETGDKLLYARWISDKEIEDSKRLEREQYIKDNHLGDPDGDGKTTASDARYVLRSAIGLEEADMEKLRRVDYYGTGIVSSETARTTLRIATGLDSLYDILLENGMLP